MLAGEAAILMLLSHAALRIFGFRRLVKTLHRRLGAAADPTQIARISRVIERVGNRLGLTCLRRAFAAAWMLQARGYRPTLHYGVAKRDGLTVAHAWLEADGQAVVGHEEAVGFSLLASFPERQNGPDMS